MTANTAYGVTVTLQNGAMAANISTGTQANVTTARAGAIPLVRPSVPLVSLCPHGCVLMSRLHPYCVALFCCAQAPTITSAIRICPTTVRLIVTRNINVGGAPRGPMYTSAGFGTQSFRVSISCFSLV
jgi:hypothetical protein